MAIKWRYVEKWERFTESKYWLGRKKNCVIRIEGDDKRGYIFSVTREADDLAYHSSWLDHPSDRLIGPIIGARIKFKQGSIEDIQKFVEDWVDKHVPKLKK